MMTSYDKAIGDYALAAMGAQRKNSVPTYIHSPEIPSVERYWWGLLNSLLKKMSYLGFSSKGEPEIRAGVQVVYFEK